MKICKNLWQLPDAKGLKNNYTWERVAEKIYGLYEKVLGLRV